MRPRPRLDQTDASCDVVRFVRASGGGAFKHGRRWIDDGHFVARSCQRHALVPCSTPDIDHASRWKSHVSVQMCIDYMSADATSQGAVMVVHEPLRERLPSIVIRGMSHPHIVPEAQWLRWVPSATAPIAGSWRCFARLSGRSVRDQSETLSLDDPPTSGTRCGGSATRKRQF